MPWLAQLADDDWGECGGERGRDRTCNRQLRRLMLYPIELLARGGLAVSDCSGCAAGRARRKLPGSSGLGSQNRRSGLGEEILGAENGGHGLEGGCSSGDGASGALLPTAFR